VSGAVSGLLLVLGTFMWKESDVINRISLFGVPWLLAVIVLLMRWGYAPQQRRYLYLSMLCYGWLATIHQSLILSAPGVEILIALMLPRLGRDLFFTNSVLYVIILCFIWAGNIPALAAMTFTEKTLFNVVGLSSIAATVWLTMKTQKFGTEWKAILLMALMWALGVMVYLYEPISCMTDPPMQWGYPRTVEGFFHALSRGQYGNGEGTNVFSHPAQFLFQLIYLADGLSDSFTWSYLFVGLIPFAFLMKMHKRERSWILGLTAVYLFISVLLVIILNVSPDRSTSELNKVFFTASHAIFAMLIGYGVTILAAYVATHYEKIRSWCFYGAGFALLVAVVFDLSRAIGKLYFGIDGQLGVSWLPFSDWDGWGSLPFGPKGQFGIADIPHWIGQAFAKDQFGLPIYANLILVALPIIFLIALLVYRNRGPVFILLALFCVTPLCSGLAHWYKCEQRNHWFGYWFGHDMFTPPFLDNGKLSYDNTRRAELRKDPAQARLIYPEMTRDAILFGGTDPGRFCPTYAIFCDSFIPHYCQPKQDQKFDRRDVYIITQNALADGTYLDYLRAQYFRSQQHDPPFFSELSKYIFSLGIHAMRIALSESFDKDKSLPPEQLQQEGARENEYDMKVASGFPFSWINGPLYELLDVPFTAWGKHVETYRRAAGVYPPKEIYIPSPEDSQNCFNAYYSDVQRRMQSGQLQPGEDVNVDPVSGKMEVSGQVAVMMINGLLCKVIFDNNPTNEFFVEESFPLPWMYPYETPFGIIMKVNRNPLPELTQDDFDRDHKFWSDYSSRLCGNWINYDTSISNICNFVQRTYIENNYTGFIGDRRFVRDEDAQKAFSKLRSSQAGMYAWRCSPSCPTEYREQTPELQEALRKETDFAFKQSFAFCPYSPEAVFRYVQFLMQYNRIDDALLIAKTCLKLDQYNTSVADLIDNLDRYKSSTGQREQVDHQLETMENETQKNPTNYQNIFSLAGLYLQLQQTNRADELLLQAVSRPNPPVAVLRSAAEFFAQTLNFPDLEVSLKDLAADDPSIPETWYDLSRLELMLGKKDEAITDLQKSINLSDQRLKTNPKALNLRDTARSEPSFNPIRSSPEFQKLVAP
jgi:tetratricopeptide (TPR) repeat protein